MVSSKQVKKQNTSGNICGEKNAVFIRSWNKYYKNKYYKNTQEQKFLIFLGILSYDPTNTISNSTLNTKWSLPLIVTRTAKELYSNMNM